MSSQSKTKVVFALMMVLFIDGVGQSIIFPALTATLTDLSSTVFFDAGQRALRDLWYGLLVCVYFFMWFLSGPLLGEWSDRIGRKKPLLFCLSLASVGFILTAVSFQIGSLWLLLVARFIGGVTSGDQAIVQAAILDVCDPKHKGFYLGAILGALTVGLVVGPLLGSIFQDSQLVSWFNIKTPFYFGFLLTILNITLLTFFLKETRVVKLSQKPHKIALSKAFTLFIEALRCEKIRPLLGGYFFAQLGWMMFYVFTPAFAVKKFHLTTVQAGTMFSVVGLSMGLGVSGFAYLFRQFRHRRVVWVGLCCFIVSMTFFSVVDYGWLAWALVPLPGLFSGLISSSMFPMFSDNIELSRQGWVMGVVGSLIALTAGISSLTSGMFAHISVQAPYMFCIIVASVSLILVLRFVPKGRSTRD